MTRVSLLLLWPLLSLTPGDLNQSLFQSKMVHADHVALLSAGACLEENTSEWKQIKEW